MKTILVDAVNTTIIKDETGAFVQFKELFELLETYANPKVIVTNANDEQLVEFGLNNVPYPVFTMKHNPDKPDPIYFKTLLEQYNWQPTDVIYLEHNPDAVKSAESVGITSYHYDKDKRDLVELKKFIDKVITLETV
jgi:HAD superfamily hydrolase (TIGR01509 family)